MSGESKNCWKDIKEDYRFLRGHYPSFKNIISAYNFNPGFKSTLLLRLQLHFYKSGRKKLAQIISNYNLSKTGAEFCLGLQVSAPIIIRHPSGIVIGGGVEIGDYCTILQGVTLGRVDLQNILANDYPRIGSRVLFGAYSAALGSIRINDDTILGAHSVLLSSTEKKGIYVGIPAKLVKNLSQYE